MKKDLSYYRNLEYAIRIDPDPEGGYVASIPDLAGCNAYGDNPEEALESIKETKNFWLESYFETHGEAPEPSAAKNFGGKILLRVPKSLHEKFYNTAQDEGVSLNQYLLSLLTERHTNVAASKTFVELLQTILARIKPVLTDRGWIRGRSGTSVHVFKSSGDWKLIRVGPPVEGRIDVINTYPCIGKTKKLVHAFLQESKEASQPRTMIPVDLNKLSSWEVAKPWQKLTR